MKLVEVCLGWLGTKECDGVAVRESRRKKKERHGFGFAIFVWGERGAALLSVKGRINK